ncbi:MAG TPA: hypothetical protein VN428_22485 [Bryobacteraceae bacterium]|nr:hypothetical protein [Bryobacteraceae bacterium]
MKRTLLAAVLATAAIAPGCRVFRRAEKPRPPDRVMQPLPEPKVEAAEVPQPPELQGEINLEEQAPLPGEPLPGPPRRRRVRPQQPAQAVEEAAAQPEPPASSPSTVPQLTQVLTPEQQAVYTTTLDRNLDRAKRTVTALAGRQLSRNQTIYLERIKSFIQQASDARRTDLVRAVNLAERASVLADDLLKSFN